MRPAHSKHPYSCAGEIRVSPKFTKKTFQINLDNEMNYWDLTTMFEAHPENLVLERTLPKDKINKPLPSPIKPSLAKRRN